MNTVPEMLCSEMFKNKIVYLKSKQPLGSVVFLLESTFYQGNSDRNHKLWNLSVHERFLE